MAGRPDIHLTLHNSQYSSYNLGYDHGYQEGFNQGYNAMSTPYQLSPYSAPQWGYYGGFHPLGGFPSQYARPPFQYSTGRQLSSAPFRVKGQTLMYCFEGGKEKAQPSARLLESAKSTEGKETEKSAESTRRKKSKKKTKSSEEKSTKGAHLKRAIGQVDFTLCSGR